MDFRKKLLGIGNLPQETPKEKMYVEGRELFSSIGRLSQDDWESTGRTVSEVLEHYPSWQKFKNSVVSYSNAFTMVGEKRLTNLSVLLTDIMDNQIEGAVLEAGVWRGGSSIYMKHLLDKRGCNKEVILADSFEGVPKPNVELYPADEGLDYYQSDYLAVGMDEVIENFNKCDVSLDNVSFCRGWFKDTLPTLEGKFSLLRVDGDLYESTWDCLTSLYDQLSVGGYIVIDDYGCLEACRQAVDEFRTQNNIVEEIHQIDWTGVYWKKEK